MIEGILPGLGVSFGDALGSVRGQVEPVAGEFLVEELPPDAEAFGGLSTIAAGRGERALDHLDLDPSNHLGQGPGQ